MKILIVQHEKRLAQTAKALLEQKGFQVESVTDSEEGAEHALIGVYDLLILDTSTPDVDGCELARMVRSTRCCVPILMLIDASGADARIEGLNAGADYCLTKPADPRELLACINALLRRQWGQSDTLVHGNTTLDLTTSTLVCGENSVRLSAREFEVIRLLFQSKGSILSKEVILGRVWGYDSNAVENHVEVYIGFLRKKLRSVGSNLRIEVRRRLGYILVVAPPEQDA